MKFRKMLCAWVIAVATGALTSGCAINFEHVGEMLDAVEPYQLYDGPHRTTDELAQLAFVGKAGVIYIQSVDGKKRSWSAWDSTGFVYVIPGTHQLELQYRLGAAPLTSELSTQLIPVSLTVEAGHTYAPDYEFTNESRRSVVQVKMIDLGKNIPRRCTIFSGGYGPNSAQFMECVNRRIAIR